MRDTATRSCAWVLCVRVYSVLLLRSPVEDEVARVQKKLSAEYSIRRPEIGPWACTMNTRLVSKKVLPLVQTYRPRPAQFPFRFGSVSEKKTRALAKITAVSGLLIMGAGSVISSVRIGFGREEPGQTPCAEAVVCVGARDKNLEPPAKIELAARRDRVSLGREPHLPG